jgi:hypothetical protein
VGAAPLEAVAGRADAVAHGFAFAQNEIEVLLAGVDDQRAGLFLAGIFHHLANEFRIEPDLSGPQLQPVGRSAGGERHPRGRIEHALEERGVAARQGGRDGGE